MKLFGAPANQLGDRIPEHFGHAAIHLDNDPALENHDADQTDLKNRRLPFQGTFQSLLRLPAPADIPRLGDQQLPSF